MWHVDAPCKHYSQRQPHQIRIHGLGDVPHRAAVEGVEDGISVLLRGQDDDGRVGSGCADCFEGSQAAAIGQAEIQQDQVRRVAAIPEEGDRTAAIVRFGDVAGLVVPGQHPSDTRPNQRMIVHHQDPHRVCLPAVSRPILSQQNELSRMGYDIRITTTADFRAGTGRAKMRRLVLVVPARSICLAGHAVQSDRLTGFRAAFFFGDPA